MPRAHTTKEFIEKAKLIHGDRYDYGLVQYKNLYTKINIICPTHGVFYQVPQGHLLGYGCAKCGYVISNSLKVKYNRNTFIDAAIRKHGCKYDYSNIIYVDVSTKIEIKCVEHDYVFMQAPNQHLIGKTGCPECYLKKISNKKRYTLENFIKKSILVHGGFYDYSLVTYKKSNDIVKIICPEHGIFEQRAVTHMSGVGCPKCAIDRISSAHRLNTDVFINKSIAIHGDTYDYSLVNYINAKSNVAIICKIHGLFYQSPYLHTSGCGCPKCASGKHENNVANILTRLGVTYTRQLSITYHTNRRLKFDFYVQSSNLMIEYNGGQHYFPVKYFGGYDKFIKQTKRDAIKKWYCFFNNIDLLIIPYWEKDIEGVLKHKLGLL